MLCHVCFWSSLVPIAQKNPLTLFGSWRLQIHREHIGLILAACLGALGWRGMAGGDMSATCRRFFGTCFCFGFCDLAMPLPSLISGRSTAKPTEFYERCRSSVCFAEPAGHGMQNSAWLVAVNDCTTAKDRELRHVDLQTTAKFCALVMAVDPYIAKFKWSFFSTVPHSLTIIKASCLFLHLHLGTQLYNLCKNLHADIWWRLSSLFGGMAKPTSAADTFRVQKF